MRQWIAVASLFSFLALCGCQTSTEGVTSPASYYQSAPTPPTVRAAAPQYPPAPVPPGSTAPLPSTTGPGFPAAPGGGAYTVQPCPAQVTVGAIPAAAADEIAQALKENEDALATLRTAERALEASHKRLEDLLRRHSQPPATTQPQPPAPTQPLIQTTTPLVAPGP